MKNGRTSNKGSSSAPLIFRVFCLLIAIAFSNFVWLVIPSSSAAKKSTSTTAPSSPVDDPVLTLQSIRRNETTAPEQLTGALSAARKRIRQTLPSFENGGVVLFHHIAKTGGITIRKNFDRKRDGILMKRSLDITGLKRDVIPLVTEILRGRATKFLTKRRRVLFLELHGDVPGLMELNAEIQQWRQLSAAHNTSFFTFSLLREPVSFHVSCFNCFHMPPCPHSWCLRQYPNATEHDFLEALQPNNQCLYFVRFRRYGDSPPTLDECQSAYDWILQNMDWIGTTEDMNNLTIPLLSHMLLGDASKIADTTSGEMIMSHNVQTKPDRFRRRDLSEAAMQFVKNASAGDRLLYERLSRDYVLEVPGFIVSRPDPFG
jgi:hypothetical protein